MKQLTELLHLLLCNKPHESNIEEVLNRDESQKCFYYIDCQLGDEDKAKDLIKWTKTAELFLTQLEFKDAEEAMKFLKRILMILQGLSPAIEGKQKRKEFVILLLS